MPRQPHVWRVGVRCPAAAREEECVLLDEASGAHPRLSHCSRLLAIDADLIVLAAIHLAPWPGEESVAITIPAGEAVVAAADALSADLGFDGEPRPGAVLQHSRPRQ
jgi:hypothetical protein